MKATAHPIETIVWHPAAEVLPDDDITVLMAREDGDVWVGWLDGDQWRNVDAFPCAPPQFWAHMPEGPR